VHTASSKSVNDATVPCTSTVARRRCALSLLASSAGMRRSRPQPRPLRGATASSAGTAALAA
jgi:hypothetical protein